MLWKLLRHHIPASLIIFKYCFEFLKLLDFLSMSHIKSFKFVYYTSMEDAKMQVAKLAYDFIKAEINENTVLGIGTDQQQTALLKFLNNLSNI